MANEIQPDERIFDLFVGAPRTGKSTYSINLIKAYPQNVIVVKHFTNVNDQTHSFLTHKTPANWRQGAARNEYVKCKMAFKNKREYLQFLEWATDEFNGYRNGLILIDDATIFERHQISDQMDLLLAMRAHYGIDVVLVYHGFTKTPIDQYAFVDHLVIFNTRDNLEYKKSKIPKYDTVSRAIIQKNEEFRSADPRTKYRPLIVNLQ